MHVDDVLALSGDGGQIPGGNAVARLRLLDSGPTFFQPRRLLCGDAEKSLAVQPIAPQHGEPTRRSRSDGVPTTASQAVRVVGVRIGHRVATSHVMAPANIPIAAPPTTSTGQCAPM